MHVGCADGADQRQVVGVVVHASLSTRRHPSDSQVARCTSVGWPDAFRSSLRVLLALSPRWLLLGTAGCTSATATPTVAKLAESDADAVSVAAQDSVAARSVAVSRALFATAPGAVVAPRTTPGRSAPAASAARAAHVRCC